MSEPCRFKQFKQNARTKIKNHSWIKKKGPNSFIEFDRKTFEAAIDSLKNKVDLYASGLDEIAPHETLLIQILGEYGL